MPVVLESTRSDVAGGPSAATPFLRALAREGLSAEAMVAPMPNTNKALYTMLCGRMPSPLQDWLEFKVGGLLQ